jgi:hypothetical protein
MRASAPTGEQAKRNIDRRTLIRRAVGAGMVAWTAPVVLDSFASPAAAQTIPPPPCGCHNLTFNGQCNLDNQGTKCNTNPNCAEPSALLANCFTVQCNTPASGQFTITYTCQQFTNCLPGVPQANVNPGGCIGPDSGGTTGPWVFDPSLHGSPNYNQFSVFLDCLCTG